MDRRFCLGTSLVHAVAAAAVMVAATTAFASGADARVAAPNVRSVQGSSGSDLTGRLDNAERILAESGSTTLSVAEQTTATDGGVAKPKSKIKKSTLWLMIGLLAAIAISSLVSAKRRAKQILES